MRLIPSGCLPRPTVTDSFYKFYGQNFYEQPWGGRLGVGRSQRFISALQMMLLVSGGGLQLVLGQFAAECEVVG